MLGPSFVFNLNFEATTRLDRTVCGTSIFVISVTHLFTAVQPGEVSHMQYRSDFRADVKDPL